MIFPDYGVFILSRLKTTLPLAGRSFIFVLSFILSCFFVFINNAFAGGILEGWTGDIFAGYNKTNGNTHKSSGNLSAGANKKFDNSGLMFKSNIFYSESNRKMDGQKWDVLGKYLYNFGQGNQWFNFFQVFVDHDYFSDIKYRVTLAMGFGYHIANTEDWIWDADAGLGYRITRYRINKDTDDEALTALAHTFMKKKVLENAFLSEDFTVYPGLKSDSGVFLRSESLFTNPLGKNLDFQLKYIIDYNSKPAVNKKKADTQIIAGIKYKF